MFVCRAYIQGAAAAARRLDWIEFGVAAAAGARKRSPCVNATTRVMQYQEQRGDSRKRERRVKAVGNIHFCHDPAIQSRREFIRLFL